jgi:hypothetical protein
MKPIILEYDPSKYRFQEWACQVLGVSSLEKAHASDQVKMLNRSPTQNQLANSFDKIFENYCSFISDIIIDKIGKITSYQSPPSFRFHYCGRGSSVFHKDRDFGVEEGRLNIWVPLTKVWGDNSLWIESKIGAKDFKPITMHPGQVLVFDGVNLGHGSKINTTISSRISFDFRVMPGPGPAMPASY